MLRRVVDDKRRELAYPVDDLARGEAEMTRLAGWVQELVAPESWTVHGGDGTLTIDGSSLRIDARERIGYETILFLERYRVARGLKPRSKYPAALLAAGPAGGELAERMRRRRRSRSRSRRRCGRRAVVAGGDADGDPRGLAGAGRRAFVAAVADHGQRDRQAVGRGDRRGAGAVGARLAGGRRADDRNHVARQDPPRNRSSCCIACASGAAPGRR